MNARTGVLTFKELCGLLHRGVKVERRDKAHRALGWWLLGEDVIDVGRCEYRPYGFKKVVDVSKKNAKVNAKYNAMFKDVDTTEFWKDMAEAQPINDNGFRVE